MASIRTYDILDVQLLFYVNVCVLLFSLTGTTSYGTYVWRLSPLSLSLTAFALNTRVAITIRAYHIQLGLACVYTVSTSNTTVLHLVNVATTGARAHAFNTGRAQPTHANATSNNCCAQPSAQCICMSVYT